MSVTAVSAVYLHSQDPLRQQNGLRQDLQNLQKALSSGNLQTAQQALGRFQQDLQVTRPQRNGVRASAAVNPQSTMRSDLQALQSALDSGDLALAQQAMVRIQQDSQQSEAPQISRSPSPSQPASALPRQTDPETELDLAGKEQTASKGNLLDVTA